MALADMYAICCGFAPADLPRADGHGLLNWAANPGNATGRPALQLTAEAMGSMKGNALHASVYASSCWLRLIPGMKGLTVQPFKATADWLRAVNLLRQRWEEKFKPEVLTAAPRVHATRVPLGAKLSLSNGKMRAQATASTPVVRRGGAGGGPEHTTALARHLLGSAAAPPGAPPTLSARLRQVAAGRRLGGGGQPVGSNGGAGGSRDSGGGDGGCGGGSGQQQAGGEGSGGSSGGDGASARGSGGGRGRRRWFGRCQRGRQRRERPREWQGRGSGRWRLRERGRHCGRRWSGLRQRPGRRHGGRRRR